MKNRIFSTFLIRFSTAALNFLLVLLITRNLGAEGRGITALITASIALMMLVNDFIGGSALVYLTPRSGHWQLLIPSYFWAFILSIVSFPVLYQSGLFSQTYALHTSILGLMYSMFSINCMVILGKNRLNSKNLLQLGLVFFSISSVFVMFKIFHKENVYSFIQSLYLAYSISFVLSLIVLLNVIPRIKPERLFSEIREILKLGFVAQLGQLIQFLTYRLSYFILLHFTGTVAVGVYSVAVSISEALWIISSSFAIVQYLKIVNHPEGRKPVLLTLRYFKMSFILTLSGLFILVLFPARFFEWIFGPDFTELKSIILLLAPGILSLATSTMISHFYAGYAKYKMINWGNFIGCISSFILNLLLIPALGLPGSAIAASFAYFIVLIFLIYHFKKDTGVSSGSFIPDSGSLRLIRKIIFTKLKLIEK